jgi:hypothetical protein
MIDVINTALSVLGTGGLVAYIFERRKNRAVAKQAEAEAGGKEIDNASKLIEMYKEALEDLPTRHEKKFQETQKFWEQKFNETEKLWQQQLAMLQKELNQLELTYARKTKVLESEIKLKDKFILNLKKELREKDRLLKDKNLENQILKQQLQDAKSNRD